MKNKIKIWSLLMILPLLVKAQTVESLIQMAEAHNPGLKALALDYQADLQKSNQVKDWPDPVVSTGIGLFPVETRLGAQRFKLGVSQMIPWKGLLDARSEVLRSQAEVKSESNALRMINIEYEIRSNYAQLRFLNRQDSILNEKIEVLNALEELAKSAVSSGKGKLSNLLFIERKREIIRSDLLLLQKKKEPPTLKINRWTGRTPKAEITISEPSFTDLTPSELQTFGHSGHPQFSILDHQIHASDARIGLTKFDSKPQIKVGLEYAMVTARNDVDIPNNGRDIFMPVGSISIPIHNSRFEYIRQEQKIVQESLNEQRKEFMEAFQMDIEIAISNIEYADQLAARYQSLSLITKETLELMRTEYATEGTRFEELLRLEMELIDYKMEILKSEFEKDMALAVLHKYK